MTDKMINRSGFGPRTAFLAALGAFAFFGCGDDFGLAKRYSVSGKVTYKGQPVEKGMINFVPTSPDGRPASGQIADGKFSLTTLAPSDGALPGKYKVTVISVSIDDSEVKAIAKGGPAHHDKVFAKAIKNAKVLIPPKYQLPETSGLEKEVKTESNYFEIELTD